MKRQEILNIIQKSKTINAEEYNKFILEFLQNFEKKFMKLLNKYESSNVRFCDYYDESFDFEKLTNYFKNNYAGKDKNEQYNYFLLYSIIKKCIFFNRGIDHI